MIKKVLLRLIMKSVAQKNMLTIPKVIQLPTMKFVGYKITTSLKNNRQKQDIPPFFHDIYDGNKLDVIKPGGEFKMYCLFNMHENQEDFDYFTAVENNTELNKDTFARIQTPAGKYIQLEFLKRNNKAVAMIVMFLRLIWIKKNGYKERKAPFFIVYDERFHKNYKAYGCSGNEYLGNPVATMFLPIED